MRPARLFALSALLFLQVSLFGQGQKEDWIPITDKDLQVKEVPGVAGAPAIQLYYADYIDDDLRSRFHYQRIKVLNEKGLQYADVEIPVPPEMSISSLRARTIHPDGKIIDFSGKAFKKIIVKGQGTKFLAQTFTLPDVTVGSIIEYKYILMLPENTIYESQWTIQHELYTVKQSFRMKPFSKELEGYIAGYQVAAVYSHMPPNVKPQQKNGTYVMEVENMPPFVAEGYMPPEEDYKPQMRFFYGGREFTNADQFWQDAGRKWNDQVEHFIGNHREISDAASAAIGSESNPEQKLRKLYARAQQIRNLSYERERTEEEIKKENLKPNQNVADVLARGFGGRRDITRLFVALARAAGFNAFILRASNRAERFFDKGLLSSSQLDAEIAQVNVNGTDFYLDPGTKYCPFGLLPWPRTSTSALKIDKKGGTFVSVPAASYDKAITLRLANMTLAENGALSGNITVQFQGEEALEHRLDALDTDEAGQKKTLEDELQGWLQSGAIVKLANSAGWQNPDEPLSATFSVEIPSYASTVGKRLLLPSYLFRARQMDAFKHPDRQFPVYFPYAFTEKDRVNIKLPAGYSLEGVPPQQIADLPYAGYQSVSQFDGSQLVTQRVLEVNGIFFTLDRYPELKGFFNKVQTGDEQQAVLRTGGLNAQKSN